MSTLVFAGGSNVLNYNLPENSLGFSEQLANFLDYDLTKIATDGASNDFLLRSIREYLNTSTPDLLVVTWQSWEREEWEYLGKYYQINSSGSSVLPESLQTRYKQWIANYDPNNNKYISSKLHNKIWDLHQELNLRKIKHVFYNEMYPFVFEKEQQKEWNVAYIGPYTNDLSFYWYLINVEKIKPDDEWYHFDLKGHTAWAKFLTNYITENKIL